MDSEKKGKDGRILPPHTFQKGCKGGPGRRRMDDDEKALAGLTRTKFKEILRQYLLSSIDELQVIKSNSKTHTLNLMVISTIVKAINDGDAQRINWFLEQLFGKLKEKREHTFPDGEDGVLTQDQKQKIAHRILGTHE